MYYSDKVNICVYLYFLSMWYKVLARGKSMDYKREHHKKNHAMGQTNQHYHLHFLRMVTFN